MELKVEVNLMNLFSDYEIDRWNDVEVESVGETIKNELKQKVLAELSTKILDNYTKKLENDLVPIYNEILNDISEEIRKISKEFIEKRVVITNKWGDIVKKDISVLDLIKERIDKTFDIKDTNSLLREELNHTFGYELRRKIEEVIVDVRKEMKEKIEKETAEQIRKKIFKEKDEE